jgi:two-component system chemotaxis sensor kinase CheA
MALSGNNSLEPMLDMFVFETTQLTDQLEQVVMQSEKARSLSEADINETFRIMHTIKGSAAMMMFDNMSRLAHAMEDVFACLREGKPAVSDEARLFDLMLEFVDHIKRELDKIKGGATDEGSADALMADIREFLAVLKGDRPCGASASSGNPPVPQYYISQLKTDPCLPMLWYEATVRFQDGCQMENIRAFTLVHGLKELAEEIRHTPADIVENDATADFIRAEGFRVSFASRRPHDELKVFFERTIFLKEYDLREVAAEETPARAAADKIEPLQPDRPARCEDIEAKDQSAVHQGMISVNVAKLDRLMDLVGELVIAEAMVTQSPDLRGLELDGFQKAARQLGKITGELQDMVMAIRMVPLATTFLKMQRLVRDMGKKLDKEVELELVGEETEVDKNIIERISDPLMHLIRNALDHGIEATEDRVAAGKSPTGKLLLEAKNAGSDVMITVRDDGRGLDRGKILARARENNLIHKPESELSDKEIYGFIFLPGFSTKEKVTEFSGRGVGMDVVTRNINTVGGTVLVDSTPGKGTTISLKIPLTLAIIDGMTIGVGEARYTIPITAIRESFRPSAKELIADPDGNEMVMVRGTCHPLLRLHRLYKVKGAVTEATDGILVMVESDGDTLCILADELIGEQQVVVKAMPSYIKAFRQADGLAGCTLLGDGSISLILDVAGLMQMGYRQ